MGEIIALTTSRGASRPTPAAGGAEILFFMGVRYYRMSDEEFAKATAPKPSPARTKRRVATRRLERQG